ncbi:NAD(P)-dependent oxidoreductase [Kiritimatiellaeota bacterium B1221]|nr:NAD(P)-dependent oxidoreductase [Kiritimatiellaeota bacterium B1221]
MTATGRKIVFACRIDDAAARERIQKLGTLVEAPEANSPEAIIEAAKDAQVLVVPYTAHALITAEVLDALPQLELIGSTYGGVRQNIDDLYALEKGLSVIHTGPTRIRPMAEYTLGLALSSLTQISNYHHCMKSGEAWPRMKFGRTRILHNRKVGVIGYGWIGQGVAKLFGHFTDQVQIYSSHATAESLRQDGFQKAESLDALFRECEVIILAGGYTPETHQMIRKAHFEAMADEALFINIARGKMVNQSEMIEVVEKRNIFLALDVFETEPLEADSPLRSNDRCLIAPHRANAPIEFEQRWTFLADELERFDRGEELMTALSTARAKVMSES